MKVTQHPLMEIIARKLSGIEGVPRTAQARMVSAACHAARKWHEDEIERLRARVAELEAEVEVEEYKICSNCKYEDLQSTQEPCDSCVGEEYPGWEPKEAAQ